MPSPFPGMDPYLEASHIWEDFHANLAAQIQRQLTPHLRPRYIAVLAPRVTYDEIVVQQTYLVKPDVGVVRVNERTAPAGAGAITSAPLEGFVTLEAPVKEQSVEIRETEGGSLITAIEILSPVNKRPEHEAFEAYQRKRRDLLRSAAHLLEIDLLRAGRRPALVTPLPEDVPYFILLSRADRRPRVEIWPVRFQEPIPVTPVPLREPDPDAPLDLGRAIKTIYDETAYDLRIDYSEPPPQPDLPPEELRWIEELLQAKRGQGQREEP